MGYTNRNLNSNLLMIFALIHIFSAQVALTAETSGGTQSGARSCYDAVIAVGLSMVLILFIIGFVISFSINIYFAFQWKKMRSSGDQAKVVYDGNLAAVKWSSDPIYESADGVAIVPNPSYGDSIKVTTAYSNPEFYMSHESKVNDDIYEYEN